MNSGGRAFPRPRTSGTNEDGRTFDTDEQDGMTLRDYFAAKAMVKIMGVNTWKEEIVARDAYAQADAMIRAGGK